MNVDGSTAAMIGGGLALLVAGFGATQIYALQTGGMPVVVPEEVINAPIYVTHVVTVEMPTAEPPVDEPAPPEVAPTAPVAVAAVARPPPPTTGTVKLSGDAGQVFLVSGEERFSIDGPIPAGTYTVMASFDRGALNTLDGEITIEPGVERKLKCVGVVRACR